MQELNRAWTDFPRIAESRVVEHFLVQSRHHAAPELARTIRELTAAADLTDPSENERRWSALCELCPGMATLPDDRVWVEIEDGRQPPIELRHVRGGLEGWAELCEGTGRFEVTAKRSLNPSGLGEQARAEALGLRQLAERFDPDRAGVLIGCAYAADPGPIVVIEGNHRGTAAYIRRLLYPHETPWFPPMWVALSFAGRPWGWEDAP